MSVIDTARQVSQLLAWGGGLEQRNRQLKNTYATVQARFPGRAPEPADCLYFGWHSTALEEATFWLVDMLGELREVILFDGPVPSPVHHEFLHNSPSVGEADEDSEVRSIALAWLLLPPSLGESWLFLLEQASINNDGVAPTMDLIPKLPEELRRRREDLRRTFKDKGYHALQYRPDSIGRADNAYSLLPGRLRGRQLEEFVGFYEETLVGSHVQVARTRCPDALISWEATLGTGPAWSAWLAWQRHSRAHPDKVNALCNEILGFDGFKGLLADFLEAIQRTLDGMKCEEARRAIQEAAERAEQDIGRAQDRTRARAWEYARQSASLLQEYQDLVRWRWDDLSDFLTFLAHVTTEVPVRLSLFDSMRAMPAKPGVVTELKVASTTDVAVEFTDDFRRAYAAKCAELRPDGIPSIHRGVAHHYSSLLLHPGDIARGILFDKSGEFLREGGAVLVDSRIIP